MLSGSTPTSTATPEQLIDQLANGNPRQRRSLIRSLESRSADLVSLGIDVLAPFDRTGSDWAPGWILQVIRRHQPDHLDQLLSSTPEGWLSVASAIGVDYSPLQQALLDEDFETADRTTSSILRQLAGPAAEARGYVYFSEVPAIAGLDLVSLDRLWTVYSQGRFGFSTQAKLLAGLDGRYDRLWPRIGWKLDGTWTRYPGAFNWSIEAPEGHMPLINQLRGVRLMDALLNHPDLVTHLGSTGLS